MTDPLTPEDAAVLRRPAQHRNGVWWYDAPLPRRWHRCKPWTSGSTSGLALVDRCACGAVRLDGEGHPWMDRNSRRRT